MPVYVPLVIVLLAASAVTGSMTSTITATSSRDKSFFLV